MREIKKSTKSSKSKVKYANISAVVTRADGTVENVGIIAESYFSVFERIKNWFNNLVGNKNGRIKIYSS